jgi:hypothetical protein
VSTGDFVRSRAFTAPGRGGFARSRASARAPSAAVGLSAALTLLLLYAAFDHGVASVAAGARIQVAVAAIAAVGAAGLVWTGTLRLAAPRRALLALGLLTSFAVWSALTLAWSVAPEETWIELNRAITYLIVLALGITAGASHTRSIELTAKGFLAVALAVALYGLGQKVIPGVHLAGVFNLDQTGTFPRLQEPFGYWNALALFLAMGVPIALAIAVNTASARRTRLLALLSVELLVVTLTLTESRGGVLALLLGLAAGIALSGARLRSLMWLGLALLASVAPLVVALTTHNLTAASVGLGAREGRGAVLGGVLVASLVALWLTGTRLLGAEQRAHIGPERARRIGRLLLILVAIAVVCGVIVVGLSSRGLTGTISHAWHSFTATKSTSVYGPARLLSVDSENRWVWWKEALGAFSDKPVAGWGAGSFPVVHLLYRHNTLSVSEAHSVPLQFLAETGLIGALLALSAYGLLVWNGVVTVRRRLPAAERLLGAAFVAGGVTYAIHACYDWDWDIPGVTLPAVLFLGVLAGSASRRRRGHRPIPPSGFGTGSRVLALVSSSVLMCAVAISGVTPSIASGRARAAIVTAARGTPDALTSAQSSARFASRLDPLSDAGLLVEADIAQQRHQLGVAKDDVLRAIGRDPTDVQAWIQLVRTEEAVHDIPAAVAASTRVLALDPESRTARFLAEQTVLLGAPPAHSATAVRTPSQ